MKKSKRIPRRALSVLMSIVMVLTALPMSAFQASAAPSASEWQNLANKLNALDELPGGFASTIIDDKRGTQITPNPFGQTLSPNYGSYVPQDWGSPGDYAGDVSPGSWVVSNGGQVVWEALEAYGTVAAAIYDDEGTGTYQRRNMTATAPGGSTGNNPGDRTALTTSNYTTGLNDTAPKLAATITAAAEIVGNDPQNAISYFSGKFSVWNPTSSTPSDSDAYDLVDVPRVSKSEQTPYLGLHTGGGNFRQGWRQSPGGFTVLRTPLEAVKEMFPERDINDVNNQVAFNTALELYYHHVVRSTNVVHNQSNAAHTFGTCRYVTYMWHTLNSKPDVLEGLGTINPLISDAQRVTKALNTVPMKTWDRLDWTANLHAMSYGELYAMREEFVEAYYDMADTTWPTQNGQTGEASLFAPGHAGLLEWFNLKSGQQGLDRIFAIEEEMVAALADQYGRYFHGLQSGKLVSPNPEEAFNTSTPIDWSPEANNHEYAGMTLAQLEAMYFEASQYNAYLKDIKATKPYIWLRVEERCETPGNLFDPPSDENAFTMDTDAQDTWLENLERHIRIWKLYEIRDWVVDYLQKVDYDLHEGANPNGWGGSPPPGWEINPDYDEEEDDDTTSPYDPIYPPDPDDPEEPPIGDGNPKNIYGNSYYRMNTQLLFANIQTAREYKDLLDLLYAITDFHDQIDILFDSYGGYTDIYHTKLTDTLDALEAEAEYRYDNPFGGGNGHERAWYNTYRSYFLPLYMQDFTGRSTSWMMNALNEAIDRRDSYEQAYLDAADGLQSQDLADEIFGGGFMPDVIEYVIERLYNGLAASLTKEIFEAMQMLLGLHEGGAISISIVGATIEVLAWTTFAVLEDIINGFNVGDPLMDAYQILASGHDGEDRLDRLGGDLNLPGRLPGYPSDDVVTDYWFLIGAVLDAIKDFKQNPADYFIQTMLNPPAREAWDGTNPLKTGDILPGHNYIDIGAGPGPLGRGRQTIWFPSVVSYVHVPQEYYSDDDPTEFDGDDTIDDGAINALIERLDHVLGSGNIKPLLEMAGLDASLEDLGMKLGDDANLQTLIESLLGNVLYSDKLVNSIYGMIYPLLLDKLEGLLGDTVKSVIKPALQGVVLIQGLNILGWQVWNNLTAADIVNLAMHHLAYLLAGTGGNTFGLLPLYPHLMGERMASNTMFGEVRDRLSKATWGKQYENYWIDLHGGMSITTPDNRTPLNNFSGERAHYPTYSWEQANSPTLYRQSMDEDGRRLYEDDGITPKYEFYLPWYIDYYRPNENYEFMGSGIDDPTWSPPEGIGYSDNDVFGYDEPGNPDHERLVYCGHPISPTDQCKRCKRGRWDAAMAEMFKGVFPLLNGVLLGNTTTIKHDDPVGAQILMDFGGSGVTGKLELTVNGMDLFAQILNPIFEMLLGEEAYDLLNDTVALNDIGAASVGASSNQGGYDTIYADSRKLVYNILDPLYQYINRLGEKPVTKLLDLLPNLFYVLSFPETITNLIGNNLSINLSYSAKVNIIGDITLMSGNEPIPLTQPDKSGLLDEMLDPLLEQINLKSLLGSLLGDDLPLPLPNAGAFMSYGDMMSSTGTYGANNTIYTKRTAPGGGTPTRLYIKADRPDVLQGLLKYVLGAATNLLSALGLDLDDLIDGVNLTDSMFAGTPEEQVAAIAELVLPQEYPVEPIEYGTPVEAAPKFPPWWNGDHPNGAPQAKLDGDYLVANADVLINVLWQALAGQSFEDGVRALIAPMFGGKLMADVAVMIQDLIASMLSNGTLGDLDLLNLVEMLIRIGGETIDLQTFFDRPLGGLSGRIETPEAPQPPRPPAAPGSSPSAAQKNKYIQRVAEYITELAAYATTELEAYKLAIAEPGLKSRPLPPPAPAKPGAPSLPSLPANPTPEQTEAYENYKARYEAAMPAYNDAVAAYESVMEAYGEAYEAFELALGKKHLNGDYTPGSYRADLVDYYADNLSGIDDFFDAFIYFLEPINQILGFLLEGNALELVNLCNDETAADSFFNKGLVKILGGDGFVKALDDLIAMLTRPLEDIGLTYDISGAPDPGTPGPERDRWLRTQTPLGKTLFPLVDAFNLLLERPIDSLLTVLPNLAYFATRPQEEDLLSPLEQALNNLLHPLYVLLDTLRPIVDVNPLIAGLLAGEDVNLPDWLDGLIDPNHLLPLNLDVNALLAGLLDDIVPDGMSINLNLNNFLMGEKHSADNYLIADKTGALFALLDALGLNDMIFDRGMVGVTKIIQYQKIDDPVGLDYSAMDAYAPGGADRPVYGTGQAASVTETPKWFRRAHAQFLADNIDLLVQWLWGEIVWDGGAGMDPGGVAFLLQRLLGGMLDGVEVKSTLKDTVGTIWNNEGFVKENLLMLVGMILGLDDMLNGLGDVRDLIRGFLEPELPAGVTLQGLKDIRNQARDELEAAQDELAPLQAIWTKAKAAARAVGTSTSAEYEAAQEAQAARDLARDVVRAKQEAFNAAQAAVDKALPLEGLLNGLLGEDADLMKLLFMECKTDTDHPRDGSLCDADCEWDYAVGSLTIKELLAQLIKIYDENTGVKIPLDLDVMLEPIKALYESFEEYHDFIADTDNIEAAVASLKADLKAAYIKDHPGATQADIDKHVDENPGKYSGAALDAKLKANAREDKAIRRLVLDELANPTGSISYEGINFPLTQGIKDEASFKDSLKKLLRGFAPVLNVFLGGKDILLIEDPSIQPNNIEGIPGGPGNSPTEDNALLRVYGSEGYKSGLLPLLAGIGADIPGFVDVLVSPDEFKGKGLAPDEWEDYETARRELEEAWAYYVEKQEELLEAIEAAGGNPIDPDLIAAEEEVVAAEEAKDEKEAALDAARTALNAAMSGSEAVLADAQIMAIFDPIIFLLNQLGDYPTQTLFQLLPNLIYFISDDVPEGEVSLFLQALDNILFPLTSLLNMFKPAHEIAGGAAVMELPDAEDAGYTDWAESFAPAKSPIVALPDMDDYQGLKDWKDGEPKAPARAGEPGKPTMSLAVLQDDPDLSGYLLTDDDFILENEYTAVVNAFETGALADWTAAHAAWLAGYVASQEYLKYLEDKQAYDDDKLIYDAEVSAYNAYRTDLKEWMDNTAEGQAYERLLESYYFNYGMLTGVMEIMDEYIGGLRLGTMLNDMLNELLAGFLPEFLDPENGVNLPKPSEDDYDTDAAYAAALSAWQAKFNTWRAAYGVVIEDFIIGDVIKFSEMRNVPAGHHPSVTDSGSDWADRQVWLDAMDIGYPDEARYVEVDLADLLTTLLLKLGMFGVLEDFQGLIAMLNTWDRDDYREAGASLVDYGMAPESAAGLLAPWLRAGPHSTGDSVHAESEVAQFLADNVDGVLNWLWRGFIGGGAGDVHGRTEGLAEMIGELLDDLLAMGPDNGAPSLKDAIIGTESLEEAVHNILGESLYTQYNLNTIVNMLFRPPCDDPCTNAAHEAAGLGGEEDCDKGGWLNGLMDMEFTIDVADATHIPVRCAYCGTGCAHICDNAGHAKDGSGCGGTCDHECPDHETNFSECLTPCPAACADPDHEKMYVTLKVSELIGKLVIVGNAPLSMSGLFDRIRGYDPALTVYKIDNTDAQTARESFLDVIYYMLAPLMPILNVFLAGTELKLINMDVISGWTPDDQPNAGDTAIPGKGFFVLADGYDGYRTGLLPLLMALGADVPGYVDGAGSYGGLVDHTTYEGLSIEGQLAAIVEPLLYLVDQLAISPAKTLVSVLPNLAYFITPGEDNRTLLSQALANLLHPLAVLLGVLGPVVNSSLLSGLIGPMLEGLFQDDEGEPKPLVLIEGSLEFSSLNDILDAVMNLGPVIDELLFGADGESGFLGAMNLATLLDEDATPDPALGLTALLRALVVGDIKHFDTPFNEVGIYGTVHAAASCVADDCAGVLGHKDGEPCGSPDCDPDPCADAVHVNHATYVEVNHGQLLVNILAVVHDNTDLLDGVELAGIELVDLIGIITQLLNLHGGTRPVGYGPNKIDYGAAPEPMTAASYAGDLQWLLDGGYAQFLADNVDALLNWAWEKLIMEDNWTSAGTVTPGAPFAPFKDLVEDLLNDLLVMGPYATPPNAGLQLQPTLEDSVHAILGDALFTRWNLDMIVNALVDPDEGILKDIAGYEFDLELNGTVVTLKLNDLLKKAIVLWDTNESDAAYVPSADPAADYASWLAANPKPLDLNNLLYGVSKDNYEAIKLEAWYTAADWSNPAEARATFIKVLVEMLKPLSPVLRLLMAEGNDLLFIKADDVNGGEGFIRLFGSDGYENGLLPLLMALGADLEGYTGALKAPADIKNGAAKDEELLLAVLEPILFLLDALAAKPVETLLRVLPNLAYFILPEDLGDEAYGESLLTQALENLLYPLISVLKKVPMPLVAELLGDEALKDIGIDSVAAFDLDTLGVTVNGILVELVSDPISLGDDLALDILDLLRSVVVGEETLFADGFEAYGVNGKGRTCADPDNCGDLTHRDGSPCTADCEDPCLDCRYHPDTASYVHVDDMGLLLVNVLEKAGLVEMLGEETLRAILSLLNVDNTAPAGPALIDYGAAPEVNNGPTPLDWLNNDKGYVQFLLDNVDGILNWAWSALIQGTALGPVLEDMLRDLLDVPVVLTDPDLDTLQKAIENLLGQVLYTKDMLGMLVNPINGDSGFLAGILEMAILSDKSGDPLLTLNDVLSVVAGIESGSVYTPLDLSALFNGFVPPCDDPCTNEAHTDDSMCFHYTMIDGDRAGFVDELIGILYPIAPVLRLLLMADTTLVLIKDDRAVPAADLVNNGNGLIKIWGANGYETGLLPLLAGIGANLKAGGGAFEDCLWTLDEILDPAVTGTPGEIQEQWDKNLIQAVLDPILFLLDALASDPAQTLLTLLSNLAYLIIPDDDVSVLSQAVGNILYPIASVLADAEPLLTAFGLDLGGLGLGDAQLTDVNALLNGLLGGLLNDPILNDVTLMQLLSLMVTGEIKEFENAYAFSASFNDAYYEGNPKTILKAMGVKPDPVGDGASYVKADQARLLVNVLNKIGLTDMLDEETLRAILALLNMPVTEGQYDPANGKYPDGGKPDLIDYVKAPAPKPGAAVEYPEDLTEPQVDFLVENVDAVLNWAWDALFGGNDAAKEWLEELLGGQPAGTVKDTLEGTLNGLLGNFIYTPEIMKMLVELVAGDGTAENAGLLAGIADTQLIPDVELTLNDILKAALAIDKGNGSFVPLDLKELLKGFENFDLSALPADAWTPENAEGTFVKSLKELLLPLVPVLRLLLTEGDLVGIVHEDVNNGKGLVKINGANGYETGLLPLLMGVGVGIPGFLDTLVPYSEIIDNDEKLLDAILNPILCLLQMAAADPVNTVLTLLPNLAYFILPQVTVVNGKETAGESLLSQALINLLYPLTSLLQDETLLDLVMGLLPEDLLPAGFDVANLGAELNGLLLDLVDGLDLDLGIEGLNFDIMEILKALLVGDVVPFDDAYLRSLGLYNGVPDGARYLKVSQGDMLVSLLQVMGAFQMVEDLDIEVGGKKLNLLALLDLLNHRDRSRPTMGPISYPDAEPYLNNSMYYGWTWQRRDAVALLDKLPGFLDDVLEMILGAKLNDYLAGLLGDSLFNQGNFEGIVGALQDLLAGLALDDIVIIPGAAEGDPPVLTVGDILNTPGAISIGGNDLDVAGILNELANWPGLDEEGNKLPLPRINNQGEFVSQLVSFLVPVTPLLDFLLFSKDIKIIDIPVIKGYDEVTGEPIMDTGVILAYGNEGYRYGLVPLLEALLMPLGLEDLIMDADSLKDLEGEEKLLAILMPLLTAVDEVLADPLEGLLKLLPSIAFFTTVKCENGKTPLDMSLDNILFAVTSLLGVLTGEELGLNELLALFDVEFDLDIPKLLDGLLEDFLGIPGFGSLLMKNVLVGTPIYYLSKSGARAVVLGAITAENEADLLTALLRTVLDTIQGNKATREIVVTMLANMIISEGELGNRSIHWGLHFILWALRICGPEHTLEKFQWLVNFVSWFMPVIKWVMSIFG